MKAIVDPALNKSACPGTTVRRLATSAVALLCAAAVQAQTPQFAPVWSVAAGTWPDLPSDTIGNVRGATINPVTTNVIFASTAGGSNHVTTLAFADGSRLGSGSGVGVSGGTLNLIAARASDDGFIYACNLSGGPASTLKVYRWASDSDYTTDPLVVYNSTQDPNVAPSSSFQYRLGDYMDVRGSGADTEIVLVGNGSSANITTNFVLLKASDAEATNFTSISITVPGGTSFGGGGVTFEGTNNALYVKASGAQPARRVVYDPNALTSSITAQITLGGSLALNGLAYYEKEGIKMLATVNYGTTNVLLASNHRGRVYQLVGPSNSVEVLNAPFPAPYVANGNGIGPVDFVNDHVVFGQANNGILFYQLTGIQILPPTVSSPAGGTVVETYPWTFTAVASGVAPITYQWYFNSNAISGATSTSYAIPSTTVANSGAYFIVASNSAGATTSTVATLTVLPGSFTSFAGKKWQLAPGDRPYLTTGDTQRGLAYDSVSNMLVVVSRSPSNAVYLINADTGADEGIMDMSGIFGFGTPPGTLPINMCGVADDGAIYVGNLLLSAASDSFALYRYQNADTNAFASLVFLGNPAVGRLGDTMAVRGAAGATEILCAFRTGTNLAYFAPSDGVGFSFTNFILSVTNLPADAQANGFAGLGLAFGAGNTFWAKSSGFNLRQVEWYPDGNAAVVATYTNLPVSEAPLGVDIPRNLVATVAFGQLPQNLSLWDVSAGEPDAVQVDREFFGANNANVNGTGSVAVDSTGGRIFALDSNNGIIALAYGAQLSITPLGQGGVISWDLSGTLQSSTNVAGPYVDVPSATNPYTNSAAQQLYFRVRR